MKILKLFLIIGLSLSSPLLWGQSKVCSKVHGLSLHPAVSKAQLEAALNSISWARLQEIYRAKGKPQWSDYNQVRDLLEKVQQHRSLGLSIELPATWPQWNVESWDSPQLKKQLDYHFSFFKLLEEVNQAAGRMVFPAVDFRVVPTDKQLISQGASFVRDLKARNEKNFSHFGHENLATYRKYANEFSPKIKEQVRRFEESAVIAVHRPVSARFWIPFAGFQNQRVTGSSRGTMFADSSESKFSGRDKAEAMLLGLKDEDYVGLSPRLKPGYGEIVLRDGIHLDRPSGTANQYGTDLWILKKEVAQSRTTWTPTDSLNLSFLRPVKNGTFNFIPWSFRSLLAPYSFEKSVFEPGFRKSDDFQLSFQDITPKHYFEAQIWGPLRLDDVQAFHFQEAVPDRKLYELLISKGIEVVDERTLPAKIYNGEESQ